MPFRPLRLLCAALVVLGLAPPVDATTPAPTAGPPTSEAPTAPATGTPTATWPPAGGDQPTATQAPTASPTSAAPTATNTPTATVEPAGPTATSESIPSPTAGPAMVRINEFLAAPPTGQPEFVELYNLGQAPADLGGWQIDDIAGGSSPRTIPPGTLVPPGGFWVITFANVLNNGGDDVRLLAPDGTVIDSYSYASATAALSASRLPDGDGAWVDGTPPTPGAPNQPPDSATPTPGASPTATPPTSPTATLPAEPVQVRLNEYLAAPPGGQREFVEVINLGATSVDLSGWRIRDQAGNTRAFTLTELLPGQRHALRFASGFLNNGEETLALIDRQDMVHDQTAYASATAGLSASRLPDGDGAWVDGTPPTPDAPNQPPPPPAVFTVRINEFLAAPISGTEFIELYNLGPDPANLTGWQIDDGPGGAAPRAIPPGVVVPAGGFWTLHPTGAFLNNDADAVRLIDPSGAITDEIAYTGTTAGLSTSRLPDGDGAWIDGTPPTPDAPNQPPPPPAVFTVRINEFLAAPISGTEFIELYNLGPDPANLTGWQIDDGPGGAAPRTIPPGVVVPPGGFWTLHPTGAFLNNDADSVRLIDPSGAITDEIAYTAAAAGLSASRLPDGDGAWVDGTPPTPDAPNQPPPPPPLAARFRLTINEFLAAPVGGSEFVEIYNAGPDPAPLNGWQIDDEPGGGAPRVIHDRVVLPPGGFWTLSTNSLLNNDADSVRLIDPTGAITDEIAYTGAIAGLSTSRLPDGDGAWVDGTPPTPNSPNQSPPPPAAFTVRINEFLATPYAGGSEYVELYNLGPDPADLTGWQIDDEPGGGAAKNIPAGTVIAPGEWWTLSWRGSFLNAADDQVRLLAPDGTERDSYAYGASLDGLSASRLPDGLGEWTDGTPPTPDAANRAPEPPPSGIVINEVMPNPPGDEAEWIELYSTASAPIDLTGWRIDDVADGGARPMAIPAGTAIAPGEWLRIDIKGSLLNDGGDWARLLAPDGSQIDAMAYGKIKTPTSWSRLPDGLGQWYHHTPPTPGEPNQPPPEPPADEAGRPGTTAAPHSILITEVVYDAPGDRDENANEWIEMTNVTSATIKLDGWSIGDNKTATPLPDFAIAPGEVVVVAPTAELLQFFPDFSGTLVLAGSSRLGNGLGNNGDQLVLADGAGTAIDGLSWGNNTAIFDPAAPDAGTGKSLQRQPADRDTDTAADWVVSPAPNPGQLSPPVTSPADPENAPPDGPPTAAPPGAVLISQVMYDPAAPLQEPGGEWLELLNTTPATLTLRGWTISDARSSDPLPTITLGPGEIGLVAASPAISEVYALEGPWVALRDRSIGGGLNNGGDSLTLRDGEASVIDALCWGEVADIFDPAIPDAPEGSSLLREPADRDSDSAADWTTQAAAQPTGATRRERPEWRLPDDSTVILSEVLAAPKSIDWNGDGAQDAEDEWIELVNLGQEPLDLAGWSLDDIADGGSRPFTFPAGTVIAGEGYLVVSAAVSGLALNNSGREEVRLLRPDGRLADILEYRSAKADRSWARLPSPSGRWVAEAPPTPNAPNRGAADEGRQWGDLIPIGQLRALPPTMTVAISGAVTVRPDVLRKHAFYLQDGSGGVMVLLKSGGAWPDLAPGQRISVRGKLSTYHRELQIKVDSPADLALGLIAPPPTPLTVKGAAITDALVGTLVQVRGSYLKADGSDMLIRTADGATVRLHPPSGMRKPRYRKGAPVQAVGIVGRYDAKLRVQLRGAHDLGSAGGLPDTGAAPPGPAPALLWLIPLLLALGVTLRVRK